MAAEFVHDKHDIGILRSDGTTKVGFMLAQKNGVPLYQEFDDEYLASQFFTGTPGYGSLPAEKEIAIRQDDWRSGLGLEVYDSNAPKRYYHSTTIAVDTRFQGRIMAGPASATIAKTGLTAPVISFSPPTSHTANGWSAPGNAYDDNRSTRASYTISPSSRSNYLELNITSTNIDQVRLLLGRSNSDIANYDVDVYYSTAWQNIQTGGTTFDSWIYLEVGSVQAITAMRIRFENTNAAAADAYIYETDFHQNNTGQSVTAAAIDTHADYNDDQYMGMGATLLKLANSDGALTAIATLPATITALVAFPDGNLYIFLGTSNAYWYINTSETFTESIDDSRKFQYAGVDFAASPTMWANDGGNTIRSATDPTNPGSPGTNWSGQTTVDVSYHAITSLQSFDGSCHIGKEDKMYYLNSSGNVKNDIAPNLDVIVSSTNYKLTQLWQAKLYMIVGVQGLLERDTSGVNTWRNPADYCTGISEYNGQLEALAGDERYLFVAVKDSGANYRNILAGRSETIDGSTSWVWHHIASVSSSNAAANMWVSSVYKKRLYYSDNSSAALTYFWLPTGYGDIASDVERNFLTSGEVVVPAQHGNFKDTLKAYTSIEAQLGHAYNADIYWECHYKKLEDTAWTDIGDLKGTSTSRRHTLYLPDDGSSNKPTTTMMWFKFVAKTDDTTKTPILLSYKATALLYPDRRRVIACKVRACNERVLKDGTIEGGSQANDITVLDEARTATWPVTLYDIDNVTKTVKFIPLPAGVPRWELVRDEKTRVQERHYNLLMQEVTLS